MTRRARLLAAALVLALAASGCISTPSDSLAVKVRFEDAGVLIRGNDVKVAGVPVGVVDAFDIVDGQAELTLEIERAKVPEVHRDAQVAVRPVSLLGERYVELEPGSPDAGLLTAGEAIPATQTRRAVEVDDLLDALDDPVSVELAGLIDALGSGTGNRSDELGATIDAAPDALDATSALVSVLDSQNDQIAALIDQTGPLASALAQADGDPLRSLIDGSEQLLSTTAQDAAALDGTLAELPDTLDAALDALGQLDRVSRTARPVLDDLRPIAADLVPISRELDGFSSAARAAVDELPDVVDAAEPVFGDLAASGDDVIALSEGLAEAGPDADVLVEHLEQDWEFVLEFIRNWARVTQQRDAVGHYFRVLPIFNTESLSRGPELPGLPLVGPTDDEAPAVAADPDDREPAEEEEPLLDLGGLPSLGGVGDLFGGGPAASSGSPDSGTGLDEDEERSLLDFVLGGGR